MAVLIRRAEYFYAMVRDRPGEAYNLLARLAAEGVDLHAFSAIPMGGETTQLVLYPSETPRLLAAAEKAGLPLTGPQQAFLITGDDRLGAVAEIHRKLAEQGINVFASSGVTDGQGGFGYLVHIRPEDFDKAARMLGG